MALRSIKPRLELGPGASFTFSHRNGIWTDILADAGLYTRFGFVDCKPVNT